MKLIHPLIYFKLDHPECPESFGSSSGCSWTNGNKYFFFFSTQQQLISCSQSATRPVVAVTSQSAMTSYVLSLGSWQILSSTAVLKLRFLPPTSRCITFTLTLSCSLLACRNGRNLTLERNPSESDTVSRATECYTDICQYNSSVIPSGRTQQSFAMMVVMKYIKLHA